MENITLETLYDALHDPEYRKCWDKDMADSYDICKLNDNNVIGWYAGRVVDRYSYYYQGRTQTMYIKVVISQGQIV